MKDLKHTLQSALSINESIASLKKLSSLEFEWKDGEDWDFNCVNKIIDVNWDKDDEEGENISQETSSIARILNNSYLQEDYLSDEHLSIKDMEKVLIVSAGSQKLTPSSDGTNAIIYIIYKDMPSSEKSKMLAIMKKAEKKGIA